MPGGEISPSYLRLVVVVVVLLLFWQKQRNEDGGGGQHEPTSVELLEGGANPSMDRGHSQWGAPQPRSIGSTAYLLPTATQEPGISPRSDAACAAPPITARVCAVAGSTLVSYRQDRW